ALEECTDDETPRFTYRGPFDRRPQSIYSTEVGHRERAVHRIDEVFGVNRCVELVEEAVRFVDPSLADEQREGELERQKCLRVARLPRRGCAELGVLECTVDIASSVPHLGTKKAGELILIMERSGIGLGQEAVKKRECRIPFADAVECPGLLCVEPAQERVPAEPIGGAASRLVRLERALKVAFGPHSFPQ